MGRRSRARSREETTAATSDYADAEGNVLTLRDRLSSGTVERVQQLESSPAASVDDRWQRREELLFERLAVAWTIAGVPLAGQRELLGRYRMADTDTRRWVRETVEGHLERHQPEVLA